MHLPCLPVTILGGSDLRPGVMPASGKTLHPLASYKGASLRYRGRPIVATLIDRLRQVEGFGPVAVAGPAEVYEPLGLDAEIVDTNGSIGTNIRAAIDRHVRSGDPGPMVLMACDMLLETATLGSLREGFEAEAAHALWLPVVGVPPDQSRLGAFAWKPRYQVRPSAGGEPVSVLPGHVAILCPRALRLPLLYRLLEVAYMSRNRSIGSRRRAMIRALLVGVIGEDVKALSRLRPPQTASILYAGLRLMRGMRRGDIELGEVERLIGRIVLRHGWSPEYPQSGVCVPIVDFLRLAEDVDTEEEAHEMGL